MKALRKSLIIILSALVLTTTLLSFTVTTSSADHSLEIAGQTDPVLSGNSPDAPDLPVSEPAQAELSTSSSIPPAPFPSAPPFPVTPEKLPLPITVPLKAFSI